MHNALILFDALKTFDRAATAAELERESGLDRDKVRKALVTLYRHQVLERQVDGPRRRGLYRLIPGAVRPAPARGHYTRDDAHRQQMAALVRARRAGTPPPSYSPAKPPSHSAAPGVLRTTVPKLSEISPTAGCVLAQFWKGR